MQQKRQLDLCRFCLVPQVAQNGEPFAPKPDNQEIHEPFGTNARSADPLQVLARSASPLQVSTRSTNPLQACAESTNPFKGAPRICWKCEPFRRPTRKFQPLSCTCNPPLHVTPVAPADGLSTDEGVALVAQLFCNTPRMFNNLLIYSFHLVREVNFCM